MIPFVTPSATLNTPLIEIRFVKGKHNIKIGKRKLEAGSQRHLFLQRTNIWQIAQSIYYMQQIPIHLDVMLKLSRVPSQPLSVTSA